MAALIRQPVQAMPLSCPARPDDSESDQQAGSTGGQGALTTLGYTKDGCTDSPTSAGNAFVLSIPTR
jgi:hypothetical protein